MTAPNQELIASIASNIKQASTQALDISFNELLDMWENEELNISPDYHVCSDGPKDSNRGLSSP